MYLKVKAKKIKNLSVKIAQEKNNQIVGRFSKLDKTKISKKSI